MKLVSNNFGQIINPCPTTWAQRPSGYHLGIAVEGLKFEPRKSGLLIHTHNSSQNVITLAGLDQGNALKEVTTKIGTRNL